MAAATNPKIYKKIQAIQDELPRLAKDGDFNGGKIQYKFLAVDDVVKALRPLFIKHGVFVTTELVDQEISYNRAEVSGARVPLQSVHVLLTYKFTFTASEDGSSISSTVVGEGYDSQDKAVRKATTSAQKIAFINTFSIETGEPDLHDGYNGAAANEAGPDEKPKSAASRKVAAAKAPTAPKANPQPKVAPKTNSELNEVKGKIKVEIIDAGIKTGEEVNDLVKAKKTELGEARINATVYNAVYEDLKGATE